MTKEVKDKKDVINQIDILEAKFNCCTSSSDRFNIIYMLEELVKKLKVQGAELAMKEDSESTNDKVLSVIKKILGEQNQFITDCDHKALESINNETKLITCLLELHLDSLDAIELIMAIEDEFDIDIPDDLIQNLSMKSTVQDLIDIIKK